MRIPLLRLVLFGLGFGSLRLRVADGASCTDYKNSGDCIAVSNCYWDGGDCLCNATVPQEIIFSLDASGSVGKKAFRNEKEFVVGMIDTGVSDQSLIGIEKFYSGAAMFWRFWNTQIPRDGVKDKVNDLYYNEGATYIRTALEVAAYHYEEYEYYGYHIDGYQRLIMLITDGNPYPIDEQNPCDNTDAARAIRARLDALDVQVVIIGVGDDWTPSILRCLVDDEDHIILADDFDDDSLAAVRGQTDTFLCPSSFAAKLTEFRIDDGNVGGDAQFVEVLNTGDPIPLDSSALALTGFVSGSVNSGTWSKGQYLVLYNGDSSSAVNCSLCDCGTGDLVDAGGTRCDNALYYECGSGKSCSFNAATNTDFDIKIEDSDGNDLVDVSYDGSWPDINAGWTFELKVSGSWGQSCTSYGTPGDGPLDDCHLDCQDLLCKSGGDTSGHCIGNDCVCNATAHFYKDDTVCRYLPPPENCTVLIIKQAEAEYYQVMEWLPASVPYQEVYEVNYEENGERLDDSTPVGSYSYVYQDFDAYGDIPPKVRTFLELNGDEYVSVWTECEIFSPNPTPSPTMSPTFDVPDVPCTVTVGPGSDYDTYTVTFSEAAFSYPDTSKNATFYRVYYYYQGSFYTFYDYAYDPSGYEHTELIGAYVTDPQTEIEVRVAPESLDANGDLMEDEMKDQATVCNMETSVPSVSPTRNPTASTMPGDTKAPTGSPTPRPTYDPYVITSCDVTIVPGETEQVSVGYDLTLSAQDGDADLVLQVRMAIDFDFSRPQVLDSNPDVQSVATPYDRRYYVYPHFSQYKNGPKIEGAGANCTVESHEPTKAPSQQPTSEPTDRPTRNPSKSPSMSPTKNPTQSPTYREMTVENCRYYIDDASSKGVASMFSISFTQPDFEFPATPLSDDVVYFISWDEGDDEAFPNSETNYTKDVVKDIRLNATMTVTVMTDFGSGSEFALGPPEPCYFWTDAPSPGPTASPNTPAPTFANPQVYIVIDGRGECSSGGALSIPECAVEESSAAETFQVGRTVDDFPYDLEFEWEIVYEEPSYPSRRRRLQDDDVADDDDFSVTDGTENILGGGAERGTISFVIRDEGEEADDEDFDDGDAENEVAWLMIKSCEEQAGPYPCIVSRNNVPEGNLPWAVKLIIENNESQKLTKKDKGELPMWIWYPIAGAALILPFLAYFGWRYYKKRKFAEQQLKQREQELQELDDMADLDPGIQTGDDVRFNPLATAGTHDIATGGQMIDQILTQQKAQQEFATEDVDNKVFRQDFGPVRGDTRTRLTNS